MEAATADPAAQDQAPEPEAPKQRTPSPRSGYYVVLAAGAGISLVDRGTTDTEQPEGDDEEAARVPHQLTYQGQFKATGARDAKSQALRAFPELGEAAGADGIWLVAVPASSFNPGLVKAEMPEPVLRGL
jgi:hypothetical protein